MFNTYKHTSVLENIMMKDAIIKLLEIVRDFYKMRYEEATYDQDRVIYTEWYKQIREMIKVIKRGGVK